jgi:putative DNA primase/helicase
VSALDNVKHWMKTNYPAACAGFSIPCEASSKEHECPLCGKRKFRVRMTGATAGTYICTCGVKGCGFGILDLIARKVLGAPIDERVPGTLARQAAKLVDERMALGFFAEDPSYTPPTPEQHEALERERKETLEKRQRESAENDERLIAAAAVSVQKVLQTAELRDCAYLQGKGFDDCLLPVTARGDGVVSLTDIDGRYRSVQYLPAPNAIDDDGEPRHKSMMKGAPISGAFIDVQPNETANTLIITEGYATARSVALAVPLSRVVAALSAVNLQNVATVFRERFPSLEIVIAADNDYRAPGETDSNGRLKTNTGLVKAKEAADASGAVVVFPGCLGRNKQDWDSVRIELGVERMTEEFKRELDKARKEKAAGEAALSGANQSTDTDNINSGSPDYNPISVTLDVHKQKKDNAPRPGSYPRVPVSVDIANSRCPDHFVKYYSERTTPQEMQPDAVPFLIERESGSIVHINPRLRGGGDEGAKFKYALLDTVVDGVKPVLRGFKDNEAYTTFINSRRAELRIAVADSADAKRLCAALRAIGGTVNGTLIDFYRNAYLPEQKLPQAVYGGAPGWQRHDGKPFYVSQNGKTYLTDNIRYEFVTPIEQRYRTPPAGTLPDYRNEVISLIRGNESMVFQVLIELASVLFPVRNGTTRAEGVTFNMYGQSGKGKTLALKVGASVWGDYTLLTESANATYTALVNSAVKSSGGTMRIDDLSAMGNVRGADYENLIYSIGNGKGKLRSAQDGKNMPADEFSVICLMTAEKTISDSIWQKEGYRFKAGAEARLIEQPFIELSDLAGADSIGGYAGMVSAAINEHNGVLGAAWLDALHVMGWDKLQVQIREHCATFARMMAEVIPEAWAIRPGHKVRAHQIYGVAFAAGMMSRELTGLSEEEVFNAVEASIIVEMSSNDIGESRDKEAVNTLWDFLTANTTNMGAIAREGNKANVQRGGNESLGWLDLIETQNHEEYEPVFYLNKKQLNAIAKNECGMTGADMLALLTKYGYHDTPDTERGRKDGTLKKRVRTGQGITVTDLIKITAPATVEE